MSKKNVFPFIIIIAALAAIIFGAFIYSSHNRQIADCSLYFLNESGTSLGVEQRKVFYYENSDLPAKVIEQLIRGPESSQNERIMNRKTSINSIAYDEYGNYTVDFSQEFVIDDAARAVFPVYAVVKTLCSLDGINSVKVTVDGQDFITADGMVIGVLTSEDINLSIDTYTSETQNVRLYFRDIETGMLSVEERAVKVTDQQPIEQYIIGELIKGPEDLKNEAVLDKGTTLISVNISNNIGFVNFGRNFIDKNTGNPENEEAAIFAIVNSLTELESVNRVQFLVEGKKTDLFGSIDISNPIGAGQNTTEEWQN